jgi:sarcosine oxidase
MHAGARYDVVIAGLGAMGSAAALHLARRGVRVLGLDRYTPPHAQGSSHGDSRIIREAYFEHPAYVPMVQRAFELWDELEQVSGATLLVQTGGLMIGRPDSALVMGARRSADEHGLSYELLSARDVRAQYPALTPERDMVAIREPRAGVLFPEACISAMLGEARAHGAALWFDEPLEAWSVEGTGVRVSTARGEYHARRLIVAAGAWTRGLLPGLDLPLQVERQVLHWFEPAGHAESFRVGRCPIHLWQFDGRRLFYGFPDLGRGVKAAFHHDGAVTTIDDVRRVVDPEDVEAVRAVLRRFAPGADGPLRASVVCVYTNTTDEHFWIDRHPQLDQVIIASACSGHGFKFAPVIGEILADMVQDKPSRFDLQLFRGR